VRLSVTSTRSPAPQETARIGARRPPHSTTTILAAKEAPSSCSSDAGRLAHSGRRRVAITGLEHPHDVGIEHRDPCPAFQSVQAVSERAAAAASTRCAARGSRHRAERYRFDPLGLAGHDRQWAEPMRHNLYLIAILATASWLWRPDPASGKPSSVPGESYRDGHSSGIDGRTLRAAGPGVRRVSSRSLLRLEDRARGEAAIRRSATEREPFKPRTKNGRTCAARTPWTGGLGDAPVCPLSAVLPRGTDDGFPTPGQPPQPTSAVARMAMDTGCVAWARPIGGHGPAKPGDRTDYRSAR